MTGTTLHRDWLRLVLEADGISDYRGAESHRHRIDWVGRTLSLISMLLVGFFVVSAGIGIARSRPQVTAERDQLRTRVLAEQRRNADAERAYTAARAALRSTQDAVRPDLNGALAAQLDAQGAAAAYLPEQGPGVVVTLENAPRPTFSGTTDLGRVIDRDVQHVVNALWQAGAEAVSVNDVRITARTSIRNAGTAILVDYKPITTPVRVAAIGDGLAMVTAFRSLPEWQELSQLRDRYRIRWAVAGSRAIDMPAGASALPTTAQTQGGS